MPNSISLSPQTATFPNFAAILWNRQRDVVATDENLKDLQLAEERLLAMAVARPIPGAVLAIREETGWDDRGCTRASYRYYKVDRDGEPKLQALHATHLVRRDIIGNRIIAVMLLLLGAMLAIALLARFLG